jgi:hypothetical protein
MASFVHNLDDDCKRKVLEYVAQSMAHDLFQPMQVVYPYSLTNDMHIYPGHILMTGRGVRGDDKYTFMAPNSIKVCEECSSVTIVKYKGQYCMRDKDYESYYGEDYDDWPVFAWGKDSILHYTLVLGRTFIFKITLSVVRVPTAWGVAEASEDTWWTILVTKEDDENIQDLKETIGYEDPLYFEEGPQWKY